MNRLKVININDYGLTVKELSIAIDDCAPIIRYIDTDNVVSWIDDSRDFANATGYTVKVIDNTGDFKEYE